MKNASLLCKEPKYAISDKMTFSEKKVRGAKARYSQCSRAKNKMSQKNTMNCIISLARSNSNSFHATKLIKQSPTLSPDYAKTAAKCGVPISSDMITVETSVSPFNQ